MKAMFFSLRCSIAAALLLFGFHVTDGGSHTDPPDVEGIYTALMIMGGSDDGSMSDPPDVERLL
ncbi:MULTISPECIES: hypothetical protein [unclassified Paenibacillus]|uniref:hypothetical protein n=1 Tax=unclassified Paenibacillus TaxID=185978 RepID=UPI00115FE1DF|nr:MULTISPECIES: hypothetical protein [unclassified Paenibacillus]